VWILIAAVILTSAAAADVTARKLDGTTVSGSLQSWQDGRIGLQTASGRSSSLRPICY